MEKANAIFELNNEVSALLATLPEVFSTSLVKIMKWKGITIEKLAEESHVSSKTIQRLRTKTDYKVSLKTVIALCIGMHLHPLLSRHLIKAAGVSIRYIAREEMLYDFFVSGYYTHSVEECNEILRAKGFGVLSGDE